MPKFLIQVAYTTESWASMVKSPQNRQELVAPAVEALGGTLEQLYFAFGEYDVVGLIDMPDNVDAAAFAVAVAATGSVKAFKTTPLLSVDESMEAMRKAGKTGYKPPRG
jgi:uncharacterized protein with GYD domain